MSWAGNPTPNQPLAGWWYRVGATVIDNIIVFIVARIFGAIGGTGLQDVVLILGGLVYGALLIANRQQTVGMMALSTKCVDAATGGPISTGRAFGRAAVAIGLNITVIGGILDVLWPLWDPQNQTLHDKAVNTLVVLTKAQVATPPYPSGGAGVYGGPPAQPGAWGQGGGWQTGSQPPPQQGGGWSQGAGWQSTPGPGRPADSPPPSSGGWQTAPGNEPPADPGQAPQAPGQAPQAPGWPSSSQGWPSSSPGGPAAPQAGGWQPAAPVPAPEPAPAPASPPDASIPAAWYPDPAGSGQERWWDGRSWTDHLRSPS